MRPVAILLLVSLMWASPTWAATAVEQARAQIASARARLTSVEGEQSAAQVELDGLAEQITAMKAKRRTGTALEASLRRSQELSSKLHALSDARTSAQTMLTQASVALFSALDAEVKRARDEAVASRAPETRRVALERFRKAREERDSLRAQLPSSELPPLRAEATSEDPEELLEQADALRDAEDKVKRRLEAVRARTHELRRERELDRRMGDFLGDESLFDEQDRRLTLQRDAQGSLRVAGSGRSGGPVEMDSLSPEPAPASSPPPVAGDPTSPGTTPGPTPPPTTSLPPAPTPIATDARPQIGAARTPTGVLSDDVEALEREQRLLEQQAKTLADQARAIEDRAKRLE